MYRCLPLMAALLLAGCSAIGKSEQAPQPQVQAAAQPDDDTTCQAKGFTPGSSGYVQCRKQLDLQHMSEDPDNWTPERDNTARSLLGRPPRGF